TVGGASTGGRSSTTGGALVGNDGSRVATDGNQGLDNITTNIDNTTNGRVGGATMDVGGTKVDSGASGGATAGTGGTKVGSGGTATSSGGSGGGGDGGGMTSVGSVTILPGAVWKDTQGNVLQAHGEGIIKVSNTYYLIGEDKTNGAPFQNVKCYSSTDLTNWTFVNNVLTRQASGDLGPNRIIERPHVIYNSATAQYVMYMHVDSSSYGDRKAGVATCSSVCGAYSYKGSVKPLGHDSLDDTLFQDGSTGYFISEDRTNTKLQIYQLSEDYLTVASLVASLPQYESPAVVKIAGTYYIFGSHLTGWSTNDNQYSTASAMSGPWSAWKSFAPSGTNTCNSQVTFILPVTGTSTTSYVFFGDRWNSNNLTDSRYIWQPLSINGTTVSMTCATSWKIDAVTGIWSP
ncbi:MAG TPA: family 43 glycosylhydrolase, partial [Polyangiaceae bacterium]